MAATPEWWVTVLTLLLGGGGSTAIFQTYRWWVDRKDKLRLMNDFPDGLRASTHVYDVLNRVLHAVDADQVLVLEARNGGQVPSPGSKLKSSVVHEAYGARGKSVKERWQNQQVDEWYLRLLLDVYEQGMVRIVTEEIEEDTPLKGVYKANGVYKSRVVRLRAEPGVFFYLSFTWTRQPRLSTEVITDEIRVAKNDLQALFELRKKKGLSL